MDETQRMRSVPSGAAETYCKGLYTMHNRTGAWAKALDDSVQFVAFSLAVNGALLLIATLVFGYVVLRQKTQILFAPRLAERFGPVTSLRELLAAGKAVFDTDVRKTVNPDGEMLIRFLQLGFRFSLVASILGLALMFLYNDAKCHTVGLNRYSLANMSCDSRDFWYAILGSYFFTGVCVGLTLLEWHHFMRLRQDNFISGVRGDRGAEVAQALHTVMVEQVPQHSQRNAASVRLFFERIFKPTNVRFCVVQGNTGPLHNLKYIPEARLDQILASHHFREDRRAVLVSTHVSQADEATDNAGGADLCSQPVFDFFSNSTSSVPLTGTNGRSLLLAETEQTPERMLSAGNLVRNVVTDVENTMLQNVAKYAITECTGSSTAFVTLRSVADRVVAERNLLTHAEGWTCRAAPEARDIIWQNASEEMSSAHCRRFISRILLTLGVLFWSVPVSFIQAWTNVSKLETFASSWAPWLMNVRDRNPQEYALIVSYLPVLTLVGLLSILPYILYWAVIRFEKCKVKSKAQRRVLRRYFLFLFASLYVTVISSSLFDSLARIIETPFCIVEILQHELPKVSVYFINFVMARACFTLPFYMLYNGLEKFLFTGRTANKARRSSLTKIVRASRKTSSRIHGREPVVRFGGDAEPVYCDFGCQAADIALILVLGLTYAVIAPAILPVCMFYFGFGSFCYRWLFYYVYTPEFDSGGSYWYDLFHFLMIGSLFGTLSVVGLAAAYRKSTSWEIRATLPLPCMIIIFWRYCYYTYLLPSRVISLEDAVAADRERAVLRQSHSTIHAEFKEDYYLDPLLRDGWMAETETVAAPRNRPVKNIWSLFSLGWIFVRSNAHKDPVNLEMAPSRSLPRVGGPSGGLTDDAPSL